MGSRLRLSAFAIAMALVATPAFADPTPQEKETARNLMDEGRELRDEKKDPKLALERFKAADQIMHVPTTGFEVASTQVSLGLLVEARETLARIISSPPQKGEPPPFKEARATAQRLDDDLATKIATLVVSLDKAQPGATILIDGVALPPSLVGLPARANPGHHVILASTKSMEGKAEVDLAQGEKKEITVTLEPRGVEHETIVQDQPKEQPKPASSSGARTFAFVMIGLAGASLVAGGVTGVLTFTTQSDLATKCPNHICGPDAHDELQMANTVALVSTVSFIAAGVCGVAGLVAILVGKPSAPPAQSAARVVPWILPGSAGISGTF